MAPLKAHEPQTESLINRHATIVDMAILDGYNKIL